MNLNLQGGVEILNQTLQKWYEATVSGLPNFIVALVVVTISYFMAKVMRSAVLKLSNRVTINRSVNDLLASFVYLAILLVGLFVSLGILNLDKTVTSLLAGAGVIGLAIGFAAQEIAANFFSGIVIAFREPYVIGDIIQISDYKGEVKSVNLRTTNIKTFDGLEVFIPNKMIFSQPFINLTSTEDRRIDLSVGISYGDSLGPVAELIQSALDGVSHRIKNRKIGVYFTEFGDSSINLIVHIWVRYHKNIDYLEARHEAIIKIKQAFDEQNITIPFPIRTLDFGIKGGEGLKSHLEPEK